MTTVDERTRSIVQTEVFLRDVARDATLPETMRLRAKSLLRHYPTADDIKLAGKLEKHRKAALMHLEQEHGLLPPTLSTWLIAEPMFCENDSGSSPGISSGPFRSG